MTPELDLSRNVRAWRNRCESITTFEMAYNGSLFGSHGPARPGRRPGEGTDGSPYHFYRLYRCSGCGRGGLGQFVGAAPDEHQMELTEFFPHSFARPGLPLDTPADVKNEMSEAFLCADAGSYRGASALLRSALEKTLKLNGYLSGNLKTKIDEAAKDGVITSARRERAHSNVRDLGNDVVHEEWRVVDSTEYLSASTYVCRIIEDFYEHRVEVEAVLSKCSRTFTARAQPTP